MSETPVVHFRDRSRRERLIPLTHPYELIVVFPERKDWSSESYLDQTKFQNAMIKIALTVGKQGVVWCARTERHAEYGLCLVFEFADKAHAMQMRLLI